MTNNLQYSILQQLKLNTVIYSQKENRKYRPIKMNYRNKSKEEYSKYKQLSLRFF